MSAATAHVAYKLARAAQRGTMHLVSERNTGALNPLCGANPVRGQEITVWDRVPADLSTLCEHCATHVTAHPYVDSIEEGLAIHLGTTAVTSRIRLLAVSPAVVHVGASARVADEALVASVAEHGVVAPIIARRTSSGLVVIDGARRLDAAIAANLPTLPVIVRDVDDETAVLEQLTANLHRTDLDPIAQANAYQRALEQLELTKEALADRLHVSRSALSNTVRLLGLPADLQALVASGELSAAHGRALLRLPAGSPEQTEMAERILAEGMSSRAAEQATRTVPAKLTDLSTLVAAALAQAGVTVKAQVTSSGDRARVVLDVAEADLPRVLQSLGLPNAR